jgi:hypothetical protein
MFRHAPRSIIGVQIPEGNAMRAMSIASVGVFCAVLALASPALAQGTGGTTAKPADGRPSPARAAAVSEC